MSKLYIHILINSLHPHEFELVCLNKNMFFMRFRNVINKNVIFSLLEYLDSSKWLSIVSFRWIDPHDIYALKIVWTWLCVTYQYVYERACRRWIGGVIGEVFRGVIGRGLYVVSIHKRKRSVNIIHVFVLYPLLEGRRVQVE